MFDENFVLGIDVGASGMKAAVVNLTTGELATERFRLPTPKPATPEAMAKVAKEITEHFNWTGVIGCGFPAIIQNGTATTASNIDKSWIGTSVSKTFAKATGCKVYVTNDADAAGVAEVNFGAAKGKSGVVILLTIGSGIGSALLIDGKLVPNTEMGHMHFKKSIAEKFVSDRTRKDEDLSWSEWAHRFNKYMELVERVFSPDFLILGGGASKKFKLYSDEFNFKTPVAPAELLNQAGIVGAAQYAQQKNLDAVSKVV